MKRILKICKKFCNYAEGQKRHIFYSSRIFGEKINTRLRKVFLVPGRIIASLAALAGGGAAALSRIGGALREASARLDAWERDKLSVWFNTGTGDEEIPPIRTRASLVVQLGDKRGPVLRGGRTRASLADKPRRIICKKWDVSLTEHSYSRLG